MPPKTGITVEQVEEGSPAEIGGLRSGDILVKVNARAVHDVIDFMFHRGADDLQIEYCRDGVKHKTVLMREDEEDLGLTIKPFKVKTCKNNCVFCFVKQLPKGLRKTLYLKDEDYRLSFLYGNYITLSNLDAREKKRITDQRLSPLYISVHATNRAVRNRLLGNPKGPDVMKELRYFTDRKIRIHTQIVLCPGYNDGAELRNTISDLCKLYPYVASIAVVPVGLTSHRRQQLAPVGKEDAAKAIETVEVFQKRYQKKYGDPLVYCADEMYLKAERPFPLLRDYGTLPQLENGVGMVPLFLSQAKKVRVPKSLPRETKFLTFTGISFYPLLRKWIDRFTEKEGIRLTAFPVENKLFGSSVTVAGLLSGRDVIRALHDNTDGYEALLVPDVMLKEDEDLFLDDVSLRDIEEATRLKVSRIEATPQGLVDGIVQYRGTREMTA